uniref:Uncharacterized protein n=1 Tax=Cacopsylla melanoneura TaxID=428564 RepID=A0A8D8UXN9_9HEMI
MTEHFVPNFVITFVVHTVQSNLDLDCPSLHYYYYTIIIHKGVVVTQAVHSLGHKLSTGWELGPKLTTGCDTSCSQVGTQAVHRLCPFRRHLRVLVPLFHVQSGTGPLNKSRHGYPLSWHPSTRSDQVDVPCQSSGSYLLQDRYQWRRGIGGGNSCYFRGGS